MERVLIISALPLLGRGLEIWLRQTQGLEVVGYERDADRIAERIEQLKPDVVIIDEGMWLASPTRALMRYLAARPGAKIIGIDLHDNGIHIFSSKERTIDLVEQFLDAIKGGALGGEQPS